VLAIVFCAIALSLAYPVREYITQRRQIDQLEARSSQLKLNLKRLEARQLQLNSSAYIERQARDRLHMCLPTQMCYVVIPPASDAKGGSGHRAELPWYARLWSSVQVADARAHRG
jgi:cell division protein FtsB